MIEIEEIKDRDSLKQWLTEWPHENGLDDDAARALAVTIAHRAAMRVLPRWWVWTQTTHARILELKTLPVSRCVFISGVASTKSTSEFKAACTAAADSAAVYASTAYANASGASATTADANAYADSAAGYQESADIAYSAVDHSKAASAATAYVDATYAGVDDTTAKSWNNIRTDCKLIADRGECLSASLWIGGDNPFDADWQAVKSNVTDPEWSFWIKWYDDALAGNPPNWDMLEQIALIDSKVWDAGSEAVAARISLIVEQYDLVAELKAAHQRFDEMRTKAAEMAQRSHNNPPGLVDADVSVKINVEIIWVNLDEAVQELAQDDPSPSMLKRIGIALLKACKNIAEYCGSVGDVALKKAAEGFGSAGGKWAAGGITAYIAAQNTGVQSLAGRLIEYAEKLAQIPH